MLVLRPPATKTDALQRDRQQKTPQNLSQRIINTRKGWEGDM